MRSNTASFHPGQVRRVPRDRATTRSRPGVPQPHGWVDDLLDSPERLRLLEGYLQEPIGPLLGFGFFGCAFLLKPPWVLKLTSDVSEAAVWDFVMRLREEGAALPGLAAVRSLAQVTPDVDIHPAWRLEGLEEQDVRRPLFAVVREAMHPILQGISVREFTDATIRRLGPAATDHVERLLFDYRQAAQNLLQGKGHASVLTSQLNVIEAEGRLQPLAADLFTAMRELRLDHGVVLADVHPGNVGWRVYAKELGLPEGLCCYDPGLSRVPGGVEGLARTPIVRTNGRRDRRWTRTRASLKLGVV